MDDEFLIAALSALAQPHRLRAYALVVEAGADGTSPGALAEALGMRRNHLTAHLAILVGAGLVVRVDRGRTAVLTRDAEAATRLARLMDVLLREPPSPN